MEAFLRALLPRRLPLDRTFKVHPFQGKSDLLSKLEARLRGYAVWLPDDWRIVVVVDRDDDDCRALKQRLEDIAHSPEIAPDPPAIEQRDSSKAVRCNTAFISA